MDVKDYIDNDSLLIQRFKETCPGTYKHSVQVSQLCEPVAKELGLNVDNLLVASILHDVGKMVSPKHFIENMNEDKNIHDTLDPAVSFTIISRHIADSVLKLVQCNIPLDIIRIVSEHHGNSVLKSIHSKAVEKFGADVVAEHYRYKSCKPSSPESCILMICDTVESACRSLFNCNKLLDVKSTVDKLIEGLIMDEQIDILSLGQLRVIKKILIVEITNTYHKRVDYDEVVRTEK